MFDKIKTEGGFQRIEEVHLRSEVMVPRSMIGRIIGKGGQNASILMEMSQQGHSQMLQPLLLFKQLLEFVNLIFLELMHNISFTTDDTVPIYWFGNVLPVASEHDMLPFCVLSLILNQQDLH